MNYETRMNDEDEHIITNKQKDNAIIAFLCGLCIALEVIISFLVKGCSPDPVPAYSMCEACGEIIGASDHGQCVSHGGTEATELAVSSITQ